MTSEKLFEALGDIDLKYVNEANEYKRNASAVWFGRCIIAAVLVAAVAFVPSIVRMNTQLPTISIVINELDEKNSDYTTAQASMDIDGTSYNGISENEMENVKREFAEALGIEYDDFTDRIGDGFELVVFGALFVPPKTDGSTQRTLHDYFFTYSTAAGGSIDIAMCAFDRPLRDVIIGNADFADSLIGDTALRIFGTRGYYIAEFEHDGINYYITAKGTQPDELTELLCGIILGN